VDRIKQLVKCQDVTFKTDVSVDIETTRTAMKLLFTQNMFPDKFQVNSQKIGIIYLKNLSANICVYECFRSNQGIKPTTKLTEQHAGIAVTNK